MEAADCVGEAEATVFAFVMPRDVVVVGVVKEGFEAGVETVDVVDGVNVVGLGVETVVEGEVETERAFSLAAANSASFSRCSLISRSMIVSFFFGSSGAAVEAVLALGEVSCFETVFEAAVGLFMALVLESCFAGNAGAEVLAALRLAPQVGASEADRAPFVVVGFSWDVAEVLDETVVGSFLGGRAGAAAVVVGLESTGFGAKEAALAAIEDVGLAEE